MNYVLDKTVKVGDVQVAGVSCQKLSACGSFFILDKQPIAVLVAQAGRISVIGLSEKAVTADQLAKIFPGVFDRFLASISMPTR